MELAEAHVDGGFSHTVVDLVVMVVLVVSGTISIESCLLLVRRCFGEKVVEGRFGRVWEGLSSEVEGSKGLMWEIRMLRNSSSKWAMAIWMAELTLLEEAETETEERECSTTLSLSLSLSLLKTSMTLGRGERKKDNKKKTASQRRGTDTHISKLKLSTFKDSFCETIFK